MKQPRWPCRHVVRTVCSWRTTFLNDKFTAKHVVRKRGLTLERVKPVLLSLLSLRLINYSLMLSEMRWYIHKALSTVLAQQ